jgi:hypothetical protein
MNIEIQLLRQRETIRGLLRAHGWRLDQKPDHHCSASHPEVTDQAAARAHLEALGLLTSGSLRIDFGPEAN